MPALKGAEKVPVDRAVASGRTPFHQGKEAAPGLLHFDLEGAFSLFLRG